MKIILNHIKEFAGKSDKI